MKYSPGQLVHWINPQKQEIVWMITESKTTGIVIHSDNLLSLGTITDLADYPIKKFTGSVTINSRYNT